MGNHYENLGVSRNASKKEIKQAYREKALKYHPDKQHSSSKSSTEQFRRITEAYEVLIDDNKRADYNFKSAGSSSFNSRSSSTSSSSYNSSSSSYRSSYGSSYGSSSYRSPGFTASIAVHYLTSRAFLRNVVFAGVLFSGMIVFDAARDSIWERHNSGKSFHDAIQRAKQDKKDV